MQNIESVSGLGRRNGWKKNVATWTEKVDKVREEGGIEEKRRIGRQ